MTKNERTEQILTTMKSFSKELFHKSELLPEYYALQRELVELTFNIDHAESAALRIWDVETHLEQMNADRGNMYQADLDAFKEGCKVICNAIKAENHGNAGEYKANRSLETLRTKNFIMRNVEFKQGDHRTELDFIVFTEKAVFVIEVKNPHKDIYIDERGNYCRVSEGLRFDKNIGESMNDKIYLLRQALAAVGFNEPNIQSLVVFTNNNINVENRYEFIRTCFLSSLPNIIDKYEGANLYNVRDIQKMMQGVERAVCKESYPLPIDIKAFKEQFANLLASLEYTPVKEESNEEAPVTKVTASTNTNAWYAIPIIGTLLFAGGVFYNLLKKKGGATI